VTQRTFEELTLGSGATLEELVDRQALQEMVDSFYELFRVPLRVLSDESGQLAGVPTEPEIYEYLKQYPKGRRRVLETLEAVRAADPAVGEDVDYDCFTGMCYLISSIGHDGRRIGRLLLGPFLPPTVRQVPIELLDADTGVDKEKIKELLAKMPRAQKKTVVQIARHLQRTLDLILFSGHKALLTSSMHLASVRESFRELEEKNRGLQEAFDRLKELDRLKSNFLATVSHELRTPLTSIIGYSEMLTEGIAGPLAPEQREFAATIHEKGRQLLELISGLLDLSKLESGTLAMRRTEVSIEPIVMDVLQTLAPLAREKRVELRVDLQPALPAVLGDSTRLRQVLLNLAENALKFTPAAGCVTIRCEAALVSSRPEGEDGMILLAARQPALRISVIDTGVGIADVEKNKVFDAFYQVDSGSTREAGGTGLGLSIVKRLVEAHQGTVRIEDNAPAGAIFVVTIPLRHATIS
jgi:two-component system, NarL family, sensor histidine kinase BarA